MKTHSYRSWRTRLCWTLIRSRLNRSCWRSALICASNRTQSWTTLDALGHAPSSFCTRNSSWAFTCSSRTYGLSWLQTTRSPGGLPSTTRSRKSRNETRRNANKKNSQIERTSHCRVTWRWTFCSKIRTCRKSSKLRQATQIRAQWVHPLSTPEQPRR